MGLGTDVFENCPWEEKEAWVKFFEDLAIRQHGLTKAECEGKAPHELGSCRYHEHVAAGKPCYKALLDG